MLKVITHSEGLSVLKALKDGKKRWNEILEIVKGDKSNIYRRLREFEKKGLVKMEYDYNIRKPVYELTSLGSAILQKLEEIEDIYEKYKNTPTVEEAIELVENRKVKPDKVVKLGREEIL